MLTGKTRYRVQQFTHKLILQVEEDIMVSDHCGPMIDIRRVCRYRDARVEDLSSLNNHAL